MLGDGRIYEAIITPGYEQVLPDGFDLKNYPNPFNVSTTIVYELSTAINVQITVADVLGRVVAVLVNGRQSRGQHEIRFRGEGIPTGVHFIYMRAGRFRQAQKILLAH